MASRRLGIMLLLICCAADPVPRGGRAPATLPALPPDPLITAAIDAASGADAAAFTAKTETQLRELLSSVDEKALPRLAQVTALREYGRLLSHLDRKKLAESDIRTLTWLPTQPNLFTTFLLAIGPADNVQNAIQILTALRVDMAETLEQFPDLTTAVCLVWDTPLKKYEESRAKASDVDRARVLMNFYVSNHAQLQFDPQRLPWQLATYLVDNVVSDEEIDWAQQRYSQRSAIGAVYFDVPYDYETFFGTNTARPDQTATRAYTLPNLVISGGICSDQAYFATMVARSVGVPAVQAAGRGGTGEAAHAWVGYLNQQANDVHWDWEQGRYPEYQFFKGRVLDPQSREPLTEADVSLLAELYSTPVVKRIGSIAIQRSIDLVEESQQPKALMQAINLSPGNRQAWVGLADLASRLKLTDQQHQQLREAVVKYAAREYPDFAFAVLTKAISGRGTKQQITLLNELRPIFDANRPDLQADLMAARGNLLMKDQQSNQALAEYGEAISQYGNFGPIAMELLPHIDALLRPMGELNRLADIYQFVWERLSQPEVSAYVRTTPFYMIGEQYETILHQIGDEQTASRVRSRLDSLSFSGTTSTNGRQQRR